MSSIHFWSSLGGVCWRPGPVCSTTLPCIHADGDINHKGGDDGDQSVAKRASWRSGLNRAFFSKHRLRACHALHPGAGLDTGRQVREATTRGGGDLECQAKELAASWEPWGVLSGGPKVVFLQLCLILVGG